MAPNPTRRLAGYWLLLLTSCVVLLLLFSKFASEVAEGETTAVDDALRSWVLRHRAPEAIQVFGVLTVFASLAATVILAGLTTAWFWIRKRRITAGIFAIAPVLATFLLREIKIFIARPRPPGGVDLLNSYAFPSGHMTSATGLWVTLMYVFWREKSVPLWGALLVGFGWPLVVGMSRIYLDVHWGTDVVAGWMLGLGLACASAAVYERWRTEP